MVKKGYKQTEIGVIPEDWAIGYLSDFGKVQSGGTPSTTMADYWGGSIAWCTPSDITSTPTKYINSTERTITDAGLKNSSAIVMPAGSILLCTRATIGELKINSIPMATNQGFKNITIDDSGNAEFFYYLLQTKKNSMLELAIGSTFLEISKTALCKIPLQIPMRDEQNKIADALSDIDNLIVVLEKQISKKKAIKQGVMQELLTGKRRLPGFSGEWETFVFGDLFDFTPNNAFTRAQMSDSGKVKNIHYGDILTKFGAYISADSKNIPYIAKEIDLSRFADKCYLQSGDIVIADTAEDETVGKALEVINVERPVLAGQHTLLCRPKVRFAEKFLGYYLNASCYHDQLLPYIVGTKVSSVSKASIAQTKLVVPKYKEQQAIASILSDMDDEITELEQKLAKYRQVKQGMMQQLLTGKIRLTKDIEDSVQAEQVTSEKAMTLRPVHNHQFDDAVAIAAIVDAFYSDKYPLGRVKVQKLLYLLHRHQDVSVSDFKKKAAGPYADTVRYKGGEPIAKKNKYIVSESGKQGTRYSKGTNMGQALDYVERWGMQADLQWLKENFLHTSRNDLELFATVDMAMCDLDEVGISVSVESIKNLIASNKEWKAKLSKTYFSDWDIARAIKKCTELFN